MSKIMYKISEGIKQLFLNKFASIWYVLNVDIIFRFFISTPENGLNQISIYEKHKIVFSSDFYLMYCDWLRLGYFQNNIFQTPSNGFQFKSGFFSYRKQNSEVVFTKT